MNGVSAAMRGVLLICFCAVLAGCFPTSQNTLDEEKDPYFLAGKRRLNSLDYPGAAEAFSKALETNPRSASAHKELGLLYYQRLADFARAIYHFEALLRLRPKDPHADIIRQNIIACKQELASAVSLAPITQKVQAQIDRLTAENARLSMENTNLQQQVATLRRELAQRPASVALPPNHTSPTPIAVVPAAPSRATPTPTTSTAPSSPPPRKEPVASSSGASPTPALLKTYTVRSGDTPSSIARRQGVSVGALQAVNPSVNPRKLRVGQIINLPSR